MGISDYQKVRILGQGSFGKVYLVRGANDKRYFAMKVINMVGIPQIEKEAVKRELSLMQQFTHPNIDHFFSTNQSQMCIVMTYCDGGDLQSVITKAVSSRKPLGESLVLHYFVQILLGLEFMHEKNVLHRDIKAQNIFLLGNGRLVLGDLGISTVLEGPRSLARTAIGTPYYMSPEIYQNKPYDYKSDVWALGCVLYELLTTRHPFDANSMAALGSKVKRGAYTPLSDSNSKDIRQLVSEMLQVDPRRRPSLSQILTKSLIRTHVSEFICSILQRPSEKMSEGTIVIKQAAVGAAQAHGIDISMTSKLLIASPQVGTLTQQMERLGLTSFIIEKLDKKDSKGFTPPPSDKKEATKWVKEQTHALELEEEKKRIIENALQRLRQEKEERQRRAKDLQEKRAQQAQFHQPGRNRMQVAEAKRQLDMHNKISEMKKMNDERQMAAEKRRQQMEAEGDRRRREEAKRRDDRRQQEDDRRQQDRRREEDRDRLRREEIQRQKAVEEDRRVRAELAEAEKRRQQQKERELAERRESWIKKQSEELDLVAQRAKEKFERDKADRDRAVRVQDELSNLNRDKYQRFHPMGAVPQSGPTAGNPFISKAPEPLPHNRKEEILLKKRLKQEEDEARRMRELEAVRQENILANQMAKERNLNDQRSHGLPNRFGRNTPSPMLGDGNSERDDFPLNESKLLEAEIPPGGAPEVSPLTAPKDYGEFPESPPDENGFRMDDNDLDDDEEEGSIWHEAESVEPASVVDPLEPDELDEREQELRQELLESTAYCKALRADVRSVLVSIGENPDAPPSDSPRTDETEDTPLSSRPRRAAARGGAEEHDVEDEDDDDDTENEEEELPGSSHILMNQAVRQQQKRDRLIAELGAGPFQEALAYLRNERKRNNGCDPDLSSPTVVNQLRRKWNTDDTVFIQKRGKALLDLIFQEQFQRDP